VRIVYKVNTLKVSELTVQPYEGTNCEVILCVKILKKKKGI
jgi:hypothetical protein